MRVSVLVYVSRGFCIRVPGVLYTCLGGYDFSSVSTIYFPIIFWNCSYFVIVFFSILFDLIVYHELLKKAFNTIINRHNDDVSHVQHLGEYYQLIKTYYIPSTCIPLSKIYQVVDQSNQLMKLL